RKGAAPAVATALTDGITIVARVGRADRFDVGRALLALWRVAFLPRALGRAIKAVRADAAFGADQPAVDDLRIEATRGRQRGREHGDGRHPCSISSRRHRAQLQNPYFAFASWPAGIPV